MSFYLKLIFFITYLSFVLPRGSNINEIFMAAQFLWWFLWLIRLSVMLQNVNIKKWNMWKNGVILDLKKKFFKSPCPYSQPLFLALLLMDVVVFVLFLIHCIVSFHSLLTILFFSCMWTDQSIKWIWSLLCTSSSYLSRTTDSNPPLQVSIYLSMYLLRIPVRNNRF